MNSTIKADLYRYGGLKGTKRIFTVNFNKIEFTHYVYH